MFYLGTWVAHPAQVHSPAMAAQGLRTLHGACIGGLDLGNTLQDPVRPPCHGVRVYPTGTRLDECPARQCRSLYRAVMRATIESDSGITMICPVQNPTGPYHRTRKHVHSKAISPHPADPPLLEPRPQSRLTSECECRPPAQPVNSHRAHTSTSSCFR